MEGACALPVHLGLGNLYRGFLMPELQETKMPKAITDLNSITGSSYLSAAEYYYP